MNFLKKAAFSLIYGVLLISFTAYILLYTYVLPDDGIDVQNPPDTIIWGDQSSASEPESGAESGAESVSDQSEFSDDSGEESAESPEQSSEEESSEEESSEEKPVWHEPVITDTSYDDGLVQITLTTYREYNTTIYVADIKIATPELLKTGLGGDRFGRNILRKTSDIAAGKEAILAVNGDYYCARKGCVLRNGALYRDFSNDPDDESLVIYADGSVDCVKECESDGETLLAAGAMQVISFGPALIENGELSVTTTDEVDRAMVLNPRCAFAYYDKLHYAFVVSDGRTSESKGLKLYQLAEFMKGLGAKEAYNFDGGGSATMYFNGKVINKPTTNGKEIVERKVSDIVYIGYKY